MNDLDRGSARLRVPVTVAPALYMALKVHVDVRTIQADDKLRCKMLGAVAPSTGADLARAKCEE